MSASMNKPDEYREHFIHCIKTACNDDAKLCLRKFNNPQELIDNSGKTFLHYSVEFGNLPIVEHLIKQGWKVNARDKNGVTPLLMAVRKKYLNIIEFLLKNCADIYECDNSGVSSLKSASEICTSLEPQRVESEDLHIVEKFFEIVNTDYSSDKDWFGQLLMNENYLTKIACVIFGSQELTKFLLENDKTVDYCTAIDGDQTSLYWAVYLKKVENAIMLIEHGANVNLLNKFRHQSLLDYYIDTLQDVNGSSELLKQILVHLENLNSKDIEKLLEFGNKQTVKAVLQSGIKVPSIFDYDRTIFHLLVRNENEDVMEVLDELLIDFRDVNLRDRSGWPPTYCAVRNKRFKKVKFLLEHGADPNLNFCDRTSIYGNGDTILEEAQSRANSSSRRDELIGIVQLFLLHGAIIDDRSIMFLPNSENEHFSNLIIEHIALFGPSQGYGLTIMFQQSNKMRNYYNTCIRQLREMRNFEMYETIKLSQLLTESNEKILSFVRKPQFSSLVNNKLEKMTHIARYYINTVKWRIAKATDIIELERKGALMIEELSGLCSDTYHVIVYKIISYLSLKDLRHLCIA